MKSIKHICFRFFLVPLEQNLFTRPGAYSERIGWLRQSFLSNRDLKNKLGHEYAIRILEETKDLVVGKLSKKQLYHYHEKAPTDIRDVNIEDWPYLSFIFDLREKVQLAVVEYDSQFIAKIGLFCQHLAELANVGMYAHGYAVSFEPLVDDKTFWGILDSAEGVYSVSFSLTSPNIFGAESAANEALKELRDVYNNNRVNVTLANDDGKLIVPKKSLESYREYADKGGGDWKVTIRRENRKRRYTSTERAIKVTIAAEVDGNSDTLRQALAEFLRYI